MQRKIRCARRIAVFLGPVRTAALAVALVLIASTFGAPAGAQEAVEKTTEEIVEEAATQAAEKAVQRVQESASKAAAAAAESTTRKVVEKTAERAATKAVKKVADEAAANAAMTAVPPAEEKGPTEVRFFVFLVDVDAIEDADQNFTANIFLRLEWKDERLADPGGGVRQLPLHQVWNPSVMIINQQGRHASALPDVVQVEPDGSVSYRQRYTGLISQPMDLANFPLDRQEFTIQFVSVATGYEGIVFVPMASKTASQLRGGSIAQHFSVPDWTVLSHETLVQPYEPGEGVSVPGFAIRFEAERFIEYYLLQVVFPMAVVVVMSWAAFWISGDNVSVRIGVATSSILTLVALRFVVANLLPRLPYMTRMDYFTVGCTLLVFLALIVVVLTSFMITTRHERVAIRVDQLSRAAFPLGLCALLAWVFWH